MQNENLLPAYRNNTLAFRRQAVERVITTIRERLDEPFSLQDMSRIAYASPFHFNRIFHQLTGLPPTRFFCALRLEAAKRLLLTTPLNVIDVCFEVGYNSLGTFTRRFTQLVGLAPCQLRHLAERVEPTSFESLCAQYAERLQGISHKPNVTGRVDAPRGEHGLIFVGLFLTQTPESHPISGTLLTAPGKFSIGHVQDGTYYLFATRLPGDKNALSYLLPERESMLVGVGDQPLVVRRGVASGQVNISLRRMRLTDPPLLISLPLLLANALTNEQRPILASAR